MPNKEKKFSKLYLFSLIICVLTPIFSIVFYDKIPDQLPQTIGMDGKIQMGEKYVCALICPAIILIIDIISIIISSAISSTKSKNNRKFYVAPFVLPCFDFAILGLIIYNIMK